MADGPEKKVKDYVKKTLAAEYGDDCWMCSLVSRGIGSRGIPDLLFCIHGVFVAIECKADVTKKPSALQKIQLDRIEKAGGLSLVVGSRSPEFMQQIKDHIAEVKLT